MNHVTLREKAEKTSINFETLSRIENDLQNFNDEYLKILADFFMSLLTIF